MSVLGSQLEMDLDPEGECVIFNGQRHIGSTGTGCYKLHDRKIKDTKKALTVPLDEKVDETWIYAPTPPPEEPDEEDGGLYYLLYLQLVTPEIQAQWLLIWYIIHFFFFQETEVIKITKKSQMVMLVNLPQAKILYRTGKMVTWLS